MESYLKLAFITSLFFFHDSFSHPFGFARVQFLNFISPDNRTEIFVKISFPYRNFKIFISAIWCATVQSEELLSEASGNERKKRFFNDIVLKTIKGAELIEAANVHLNNVQLFCKKTKPVIYVENSSEIELNTIKFSANTELLLNVNEEKSKSAKVTNTDVHHLKDKVKYNNGAVASANLIQ